jgi:hypothetical protein
MRKLVFTAALSALVFPAHLHAQPVIQIPGQVADAAKPRHPRGDGAPRHVGKHLFISPSGEPFRGRNALSAWFAQADADHDGAISAAEFQADAERVFKLYDTNHDGVIDGFEIQAYERDVAPEITEFAVGGPMPGPGGDWGGGGRHHGGHGRHREGGQDLGLQTASAGMQAAGATGAARFSLLNEPEPLLAADENVDGKVSRAEWMRATARRFAKLDKTHAGKLTLDTLEPPRDKKGADE